MVTLNLIHPEASDIKFSILTFPDGQPHIKLDNLPEGNYAHCRILTRLSSPSDLLLALFANNALKYMGVEKIELHISYLIAARMDRVMTNGEPFSLKVIAQLLNTADFDKVKIFDPHSEVSTALIESSYPVTNKKFAADVLNDIIDKNAGTTKENISLVAPDAGALKKIYNVAEYIGGIDVVECSKERDVATGKLSGFKVYDEHLEGRTCLILDDILDGGGTFAGIAGELIKKGVGKIFVAVSHGIFSKGYELPYVHAIYTTNSFREFSDTPDKITVYGVEAYLAD